MHSEVENTGIESNVAKRPSPVEFDDYRVYLRAMIAFLKATQSHFSYRYFSRKAGYASPNFLKLVADGKRNLSHASIGRFARALGLDDHEQDAFEALVLLGQARTDEERNRYYTRLRKRANLADTASLIERAQYDVYTLWYATPIREMLLLPDFREDPEWIGARLSPPVRPAEVRRALELLQQVGLVKRDEQGLLRPASVKLSTGPTARSLAVRNYHRAMLGNASRALDRIPVGERHITSLTLSLTKEQYARVVQRVDELIGEFMSVVEDEPQAGDEREVFVLGFQAFPVTKKD